MHLTGNVVHTGSRWLPLGHAGRLMHHPCGWLWPCERMGRLALATYVLVHGSWCGGWHWQRVMPRLRAAGHDVYSPTMTGLGERSHLANPNIGLDLHIKDIVNVLVFEDLASVILVGHSWGGMVITGVAEQLPDRIARLVYLDAFVPDDGQSVFDLNPGQADHWEAQEIDGLVPIPDPSLWNITDPADVAWLTRRFTPMPIKTHRDRIRIPRNHAALLPRTFIYCAGGNPRSGIAKAAQRARAELWDYHELPTTHLPTVTMPDRLADILLANPIADD